MKINLQSMIAILIFILSPLCLMIGYKKTEYEFERLLNLLSLSIDKDIFLEKAFNVLYLESRTHSMAGSLVSARNDLLRSYRNYLSVLDESHFSSSKIKREKQSALSIFNLAKNANVKQDATDNSVIDESLDKKDFYEEIGKFRGNYWVMLISLLLIPTGIAFVRTIYNIYVSRKFVSLQRGYYIDALTGVHNRKYIGKLLKRKNLDYLLMIDVDDFKKINDNYGHVAGDVVLTELARKLKEIIRIHDAVVRFGGDEFIIFLFNTTLSGAVKVAERINEFKSSVIHLPEKTQIRMPSVSTGIAPFIKSFEETLKKADQSIYNVKLNGKGGFTHETCYAE